MNNWIRHKNTSINLNNVFSYTCGSFQRLTDIGQDKSEIVYCIQFDSVCKKSHKFEFETEKERDDFSIILDGRIDETLK